MTRPTIDRKAFLSASVAAYATVALGGCSGESETIRADDDTGDTNTGGTATGGRATGGTATGGRATGGTATGGRATGGTGTGGTRTGGAATGGTATGGTATGGTATGGTNTGGIATGGTSGSGGSSYACKTVTDNGHHSHPLTVPGSDVLRGYQDAPYLLEDGGTGHAHTVSLSAYEFLYLQAGVTVVVPSSNAQGHTHDCLISCVPG
jgi:hypothetical protein